MSEEDIKKSLFKIAGKAANRDDIYFDGHASTELSQLLHNALALINRQQAEIERLQKTLDDVLDREPLLVERAEKYAIKEFAERFIDEECAYCSSESDEMIFFKERFDNFLAEMVGGMNEKNS